MKTCPGQHGLQKCRILTVLHFTILVIHLDPIDGGFGAFACGRPGHSVKGARAQTFVHQKLGDSVGLFRLHQFLLFVLG